MVYAPTTDLDAALVLGTAAGDQAAFEKLFRRFERPLYAYFTRLVKDQATAEDLVCETLTAVWKGARGFRGDARVSTWVFGIAHRIGATAIRAKRPSVSLEEIEEPIAGGSLEEEGERMDLAARIRQAMARLSPEHQEVVELVFYHGFAYLEIARILGVPVNTVKTRMFYARQKLRAAFETAGITDAV
jgi:RNA polymerase sigma-70 factor (ECF subfamily)